MKFIRNMLGKIIKWACDSNDYPPGFGDKPSLRGSPMNYASKSTSANYSVGDYTQALAFTVYPAQGGKVIQFSKHDIKSDRSVSSMYVITEKDDLGKELGEIITRECLSR